MTALTRLKCSFTQLHCKSQCSSAWHSSVQDCAALHCIAQHCNLQSLRMAYSWMPILLTACLAHTKFCYCIACIWSQSVLFDLNKKVKLSISCHAQCVVHTGYCGSACTCLLNHALATWLSQVCLCRGKRIGKLKVKIQSTCLHRCLRKEDI